MNIRITNESALEHLELLYKLNGIGKTVSGDYMHSCENGWFAVTPDESASMLAGKLKDVDTVRYHICTLGVGGFSLPDPEIVIGEHVICFDDKNDDGEPVAIVHLKDDSLVEITHREFALDLEEQFFILKHYTPQGKCISEITGGLEELEPDLLRLAEKPGIPEDRNQFCPVCGAKLDQEKRYFGFSTQACPGCGCEVTRFHQSGSVAIESGVYGYSASADNRKDSDSVHVLIFLEYLDNDDAITGYNVPLDHSATPEDLRKYAAIGYKVAARLYEKHCWNAVIADSDSMWKEAVRDA